MSHLKKLILTFVIITSILISGCSKYKVYKILINNERQKAELVLKEAEISIGDIVYLETNSEKPFIPNKMPSQKPMYDQKPIQEKEVILMVHGFGGNKDHWLSFSEKLANDYSIVIPDLPGHGDSISDFTDIYTIENQAKWLNEFMETINIKTFHVVGNSMGGAIALKLTHLFPDKVTSLTLINSGGLRNNKSEYVELLKKGINPLVVSSTEEFKELMSFVMERKPYIPEPVYEVLAERKIARKILDQKIFLDILTDINTLENVLSEINKPTLIIWGKKDRVLNVDNAEEFHKRIAGSQKIILKDVGHLPMLEDPKQTRNHYSSFLLSCKRYY